MGNSLVSILGGWSLYYPTTPRRSLSWRRQHTTGSLSFVTGYPSDLLLCSFNRETLLSSGPVKNKNRINKAETLNFLLTHIVVDRGHSLKLDQLSLFKLTTIAQRATDEINHSDVIIPHEVIETLAEEYLDSR